MAEKTPEKQITLGIAPELRNRIYYAVLTQPEPLDITDLASYREPALLSVCRQIRNEAIGIYYTDNSFIFKCCTVGYHEVLPFCEVQRKYHVARKLKFDRLVYVRAWLKWYHKYPEETPRPREKPKSDKHIVEAFNVIDTMRDRTWSTVEEKLARIFSYIASEEDRLWWDDGREESF